ncbi:MAG: TrkH family potassium uptake protein [Trueperaceae bacterium]
MPTSGERGRFAPFVLGTGLLGLAAAAVVFAVGALLAGEDARGFAAVIGAATALGAPLRWIGRAGLEPTRREALVAVLALWFLIPLVGAAPYVASAAMTPLNALFESMSGFTATGATAIADFDAVPASVFLWRAFSQWVGGVGILVLFIAVFPQLAIAGRQIFYAEMPGPTQDRLTPRLRQTAGMVLGVYVTLTVVCATAYVLAAMPLFDAVAHALTTVAAAGFSPSARSFEAYHPAVDWVALVFMTLAAVNFVLLYRAFVGRPRDLWRDPELRAYVTIVAVVGALVVGQVWHLYAPGDAIRHGLFQVVSVITTTGYASVDYNEWPDAARALLIALMAIGGSAGSAAGGVKVARWLIIAKHTSREVRRALHPRAVLPIRVGDRVIGEDVLRAVAAFISLYTALVVFSTLVVALTGEDLITAFTASAATVGNIGPGLGTVGPMGSFADLHPVARGLLTFNMYAGRLEIVTVFVLATGGWWKLPRSLRRQDRLQPRSDAGPRAAPTTARPT